MSNKSYRHNYIPLSATPRRHYPWIFSGSLLVLGFINVITIMYFRATSPTNVLDAFEPLNPISPVHQTIAAGGAINSASLDMPSPEQRAVVTTLYSESYTNAVLTLGRSLQDVHTAARRILLYFPERLSNRTLCQLQEAGWELRPIARIPPPNGGKGIHPRFQDQYSKLQIWELDQIGIKSVVYLDGDTLVRQNFDELWGLPFEFAAVPDVYGDSRGFALSFNAGMMLLRTSSTVFSDMISKIQSATYGRVDAEQGFLNAYFALQVVRLPYAYNANLVIKQRSPTVWHAIEEDIRIIHYTMMKPFINEERGRAIGRWEAELDHWDSTWRNVSVELKGKC